MTLQIDDKSLTVRGRFPRIIRLEAEYYEWVDDPQHFIGELKARNAGADLFTFVQKVLPERRTPCYGFYRETERIAVVEISTYEKWWDGLRHETRVKIRKAKKQGVETRLFEFNDDVVREIKKIYDESPLRQGKPFRHYRESLEQLKREHSSFLERSQFIGAFYEGELIGFAKIVHDEGFAASIQVISMIRHRNKAPTNALMAKIIEVCAKRGIRYFQYGAWSKRGLGAFKENHGFQPVEVPRYYVPLNLRGEVALRLKAHHRVADYMPELLVDLGAQLRNRWYEIRVGASFHSTPKG